MARILDLGGEVKVEDRKGREIVKAPLDYVKADLAAVLLDDNNNNILI